LLAASDAGDDPINVFGRQRRAAALLVPATHQLVHDGRVEVSAQEVAGQPSNTVVALAFVYAVSHELTPV
jgi:hypothetical protein